jgi:hypothetical protein
MVPLAAISSSAKSTADSSTAVPARICPRTLVIIEAISDRPDWGDYLVQRSRLITDLAHDVRHHALDDATKPAWAPAGRALSAALIGDIAIWRAANSIDPHHRPTGPAQLQTASIEWRQRLDQSIAQASADPASLDAARRQAAARTLQSRRHDSQDHHWPHQPEVHRGSLPPSPGR